MLGPTDRVTVVGQIGCGKSTLSRKLASLYNRRIVLDRLREWDEETPPKEVKGPYVTTDNFSVFADLLKKPFRGTIVLHFELAVNNDDAASEALKLVYMRGKITGENTCLLVEEVQNYAGPTSVLPWFNECVCTGRHANLSIIANSQRPALISKTLISQSAHVFCGQLFEPRDIAYLSQAMGKDVSDAAKLEKGKFLHYRLGSFEGIMKAF